jgi:hypothetical protein
MVFNLRRKKLEILRSTGSLNSEIILQAFLGVIIWVTTNGAKFLLSGYTPKLKQI